MSVCPRCGEIVSVPIIRLVFQEDGFGAIRSIVLFQCSKCMVRFTKRTVDIATSSRSSVQTANVKNIFERLTSIRGMLMATLKELREKIKVLEEERNRLLTEVEGLRKAAEARVTVLEGEVGELKGEAKALREILAGNGQPAVVPTPPGQFAPARK